jgi:Cu(I)/Ag(I) efflux system membrane fusion protein
MELVPASGNRAGGDNTSIMIDPATRRVANIRTEPAALKTASRQIRVVGQIHYDEGKLKTLAAYVDGRIDRMYADYTGVVVNKGDELALLYSPRLYTAQTELLSAQRAAEQTNASLDSGSLNSADLAASARQKLVDLGMTKQQIDEIERTGQPVTRVKLVAPIHGTVIDRLVAEGEYIKTGQPIYRLADLSTVWLMLKIFPEDAAAVRYGQRVEAEVESLPGESFSGRVAFVDPTVDLQTRTVGVRVVVKNEDGRLRVGEYVKATIDVPNVTAGQSKDAIYDPELAGKWISPRHPHVIEDGPGNCEICGIELVPASRFGFTSEPAADRKELVVPRNAVLMAADNSVVYVETEPGQFELRRVTLGPSLGHEIVVVDGVKEGELVATHGNFLIDSQMQLAGNPSLIDPTKAEAEQRPKEPDGAARIEAALAELSEEDRALARAQRICPVSEAPLGSMGVPTKVNVDGRGIFICCEGCRQPLLDDPEKYSAVLDAVVEPREQDETEALP